MFPTSLFSLSEFAKPVKLRAVLKLSFKLSLLEFSNSISSTLTALSFGSSAACRFCRYFLGAWYFFVCAPYVFLFGPYFLCAPYSFACAPYVFLFGTYFSSGTHLITRFFHWIINTCQGTSNIYKRGNLYGFWHVIFTIHYFLLWILSIWYLVKKAHTLQLQLCHIDMNWNIIVFLYKSQSHWQHTKPRKIKW